MFCSAVFSLIGDFRRKQIKGQEIVLNKNDSNLTALFSFDNSINTYKMNALWQSPWIDTASSGLLVTYQQEQTTTTIPSGCAVQIQYRVANKTDFSDATAWSNTSFNLSGRFIQSQAVLTRDFVATQSPSVSNIAVAPDVVGQEITTNLISQPESIDNAYWAKTWLTVSADVVPGPFGIQTADKLVDVASTSTSHFISRNSIFIANTTVTVSLYAKAAERNWICIDGQSSNYRFWFDLTNGVTGTATGGTSTITSVGNGWYRCSATFTPTTTGINIVVAPSNGVQAYAGDGTSGLYIWGIQIENRAYASPYTSSTRSRPKSVMIEEGTTNLVRNGSLETNTTDWFFSNGGSANGAISRIANDGVIGSSCIEYTVSNFGTFTYFYNNFGSYSAAGTLVAGTTYTLSFWARSASTQSISSAVKLCDGTSANVVASAYAFTATKNWKKYTYTFTAAINSLTSTYVYFYVSQVGSLRIDGVQLEQKSYATSYTDYGVVRSADLLTIPTSGNINFNSCTIITKAYFDGIATQTSPSLDNYLFRFANGSNALYLIRDTKFRLINNSGAQTNVDGTKVASTPGWYTVGVRFSTTEASIWVNGVKTGTTTNPNLPSVHGTLNIGCFNSGAGYWNNFIEDFNIFHEALTDAEMATYTAASGYVPLTEKHSYKLGFENQLVHGEGGYRIGNAYDLTQLGTIASSYIASTQNVPASSTVVIETTTDNGVTWYPITQSGAITGLTNGVAGSGKIFKVRQKFTTTNVAAIPSVSDYTVKIGQQTSGTTGYIKPLFNKLVVTPTNITKWQIENKKYTTSYIEGTRLIESLTIPTTNVLHPSSGTIIIKAYTNGDLINPNPANGHILFECGINGNANNLIALYKAATGEYTVRASNAAGTTTLAQMPATQQPSDGWHTLAIRWSSSELSFWMDGVKKAFTTNPNLPSVVAAIGYIGISRGSNQSWDNLIDSVDIFGESLSDAEMAAYTTSGTVLTEKHTYKLTFDNQNLNYAGTGIWYSDWLDAGSNCADTPWLAFESTYNKPDGTDIKYYFRASNTGSTSDATAWVTDITQITGRFLQIKAVLISNDVVNTTPSITYMEATAKFS
jgi:hypothetical protein